MVKIFLNLLALGTLISGIFSITSKNPVISVIFLISTFVQAAGYLILIGINFMGISYIVIYVGAIAVLFLFVIMMINIKLTDILDSGIQYTKNLPLAIAIGSLFIFIIFTVIPFNFYNDINLYSLNSLFNIYNFNTLHTEYLSIINNINLASPVLHTKLSLADTNISAFSQIALLGHNLYTNGAILLIILSFILLLAMFAIIIISSRKTN